MTAVASWTVLDSQLSFADPWLRVRSDRVRTAEGDVFGPYHVIEYPDWVTIVPLVEGSPTRFGPLPGRLRCFLAGEASDPAYQAPSAATTVGG